MTVPNLDGVVPQTGHNLVVVVLKTVNALGILGSAIDSLQVVVAGAPVVFDRVDVLRRNKSHETIWKEPEECFSPS